MFAPHARLFKVRAGWSGDVDMELIYHKSSGMARSQGENLTPNHATLGREGVAGRRRWWRARGDGMGEDERGHACPGWALREDSHRLALRHYRSLASWHKCQG